MEDIIKNGKFIIKENDVEKVYNILYTFYSNKFSKNYIVYTDYLNDEEGNTNIFVSVYNPDNSDLELFDVESEEELKIINEKLNYEFDKFMEFEGDN